MTPSTGSSVFPTYVALVPLEEDRADLLNELIEVAAALQIQVTRDLHSVWDVSAAVVPFPTLDQVPPAYIPLTVTANKLPLDRKGFHFALNGLPFAVVEYDKYWSLAASHELLEMLCDPHGQRMVLAPSLRRAAPSAERAAPEPLRGYPEARPRERARVERDGPGFRENDDEVFNYILEVCDPCEYSTYTIDGVVVSDFVTPAYYQVGERSHGRCSFLKRVQRPLEILEGGAISWRRYPPTGLIYQAYSETDEESLRPRVFAGESVTSVPESELKRRAVGASSRFSIDAQRRRQPTDKRVAAKSPPSPRHEPKKTGQGTLRADIEALLAWVNYQATAEQPDLDAVIKLLHELVDDSTRWARFNQDPKDRLMALNRLKVPLTHRDPSSRVSIDTLQQVLYYLETQKGAGDEFGSSSILGLWLAVQIG